MKELSYEGRFFQERKLNTTGVGLVSVSEKKLTLKDISWKPLGLLFLDTKLGFHCEAIMHCCRYGLPMNDVRQIRSLFYLPISTP